ncbi:hypothetical protein AVEN_34333-1 [Araneus ventricosus]|uniref:Uncharacterized protein n=1 Tax=Araneus ventricosus TaxID=182803 RepID=A0A4Y2G5K1_ARAVE|nr:hypothetical protein AVEN_34333-1 [Araneus ventricosus]
MRSERKKSQIWGEKPGLHEICLTYVLGPPPTERSTKTHLCLPFGAPSAILYLSRMKSLQAVFPSNMLFTTKGPLVVPSGNNGTKIEATVDGSK